VTRLEPGGIARTFIFSSNLADDAPHYPAGDYVLDYEGEGTFDFGSNVTVVSAVPGRQVLRVVPERNGIEIDIVSVNSGNYLRNIHLRMPSDAPADEVFNPAWLGRIRPFQAIRFMIWMTGDSSEVFMPRTWADHPEVDDARWNTKGVPVEIMVALCNRLGADPWFSIPHTADDGYVTQFAQYVAASLDTGLTVYVEHPNEVWNRSYPHQYGDARTAGDALGFTPAIQDVPWAEEPLDVAGMRYHAVRSCQIGDIFARILGADRVVCVLATCTEVPDFSDDMLAFRDTSHSLDPPEVAAHIDALAIGPYFVIDESINTPQALLAMGIDGLMNYVQTQSVPDAKRYMARHAATAAQHGIPMVAYEGGQGLGTPTFRNTEVDALIQKANRNPRMRDCYDDYLAAWESMEVRGGLFNHLEESSRYFDDSCWGALEYIDQPRSEAPKYDGLMRFIERHAARPGMEPTVGLGAGSRGYLEVFRGTARSIRADVASNPSRIPVSGVCSPSTGGWRGQIEGSRDGCRGSAPRKLAVAERPGGGVSPPV